MLYASIDVHKRCAQICIENEDGEILERRILTERRRLLEEFGERPRMRILLESATESEWVSRWLESVGHEVIVGNPTSRRCIPAKPADQDRPGGTRER